MWSPPYLFFLSLDLLGWSSSGGDECLVFSSSVCGRRFLEVRLVAYPVDSPSSFSALCELVGCSCSICRRGHKWFGSLSRFWWSNRFIFCSGPRVLSDMPLLFLYFIRQRLFADSFLVLLFQ